MIKKVLITTSVFGALDDAPIKELEQNGYDVLLNPFKRKLTKEESKELLPGVTGLIAGLETLDEDVLQSSDLKVISRCGSGMSNVDIPAAEKLGIKVCNTPDGPTNAVAELCVGALLNLLRHVQQMNQALHHGQWDKKIGCELKGKTVCIIGFGRIGQRVAELIQPFGIHLLVVDPFFDIHDEQVQIVPLQTACPEADIFILHCSGDDCILDEEAFQLMKEGVFILNASRGGLIDEKCLTRMLKDGKVAGAWLDAFEQEPYKGPLTEFDQVILTPHVGSYTKECRISMEKQAVVNLMDALKDIL